MIKFNIYQGLPGEVAFTDIEALSEMVKKFGVEKFSKISGKLISEKAYLDSVLSLIKEFPELEVEYQVELIRVLPETLKNWLTEICQGEISRDALGGISEIESPKTITSFWVSALYPTLTTLLSNLKTLKVLGNFQGDLDVSPIKNIEEVDTTGTYTDIIW